MGDKLDGRLVLITGASAGIGRAAAVRFVGVGARVVGVARDHERLERLSAELGGPSKLLPVVADVVDPDAMSEMSRRVIDEAGLPDVVVANAGIGLDALFVDTGVEEMRRVFEVNLFGVVRTIQPFLRGMLERGSGRLLLISSVVGKRGLPGYSAYSASKFALHGIGDCLRAELHGTGVSVGLICPSSTESEFHDRARRSGPGQKKYRPLRHSTDSVAAAIVRMARSRRREMLLSPEGRMMVLIDTLAPWLVDRVLSRLMTRRR